MLLCIEDRVSVPERSFTAQHPYNSESYRGTIIVTPLLVCHFRKWTEGVVGVDVAENVAPKLVPIPSQLR